jgi:hypothetical protein
MLTSYQFRLCSVIAKLDSCWTFSAACSRRGPSVGISARLNITSDPVAGTPVLALKSHLRNIEVTEEFAEKLSWHQRFERARLQPSRKSRNINPA